jgi:hypothetical protein
MWQAGFLVVLLMSTFRYGYQGLDHSTRPAMASCGLPGEAGVDIKHSFENIGASGRDESAICVMRMVMGAARRGALFLSL